MTNDTTAALSAEAIHAAGDRYWGKPKERAAFERGADWGFHKGRESAALSTAAESVGLRSQISELVRIYQGIGHTEGPFVAAELRHALASTAAQPPAGWVMVPMEPTDAMIRAGEDAENNDGETYLRPAWRYMLAAAPKAEPAQPDHFPDAGNMVAQPAGEYPPLPSLWHPDTVGGMGWTTDELLSIHAYARAYVDADRAMRAQAAPIDMVLQCPKCGLQHIDAPESRGRMLYADEPIDDQSFTPLMTWANPPHRSHLCHGCGHIWRPADVPTNGVQAVKTKGKADSSIAPGAAPVAQGDAEDAARYRWLRSGVRERQGIPVSGHRTISSGALRALMEFNFWCTPGELDTAIDAARSQAKEGGAA